MKKSRTPKSIDAHVLCKRCGYDLIGQGRDARCPECGQSVAGSVREHRLQQRLLTSGAVGMGAGVVSAGMAIAATALTLTLVWASPVAPAAGVWSYGVIGLLVMVTLFLTSWGMVLFGGDSAAEGAMGPTDVTTDGLPGLLYGVFIVLLFVGAIAIHSTLRGWAGWLAGVLFIGAGVSASNRGRVLAKGLRWPVLHDWFCWLRRLWACLAIVFIMLLMPAIYNLCSMHFSFMPLLLTFVLMTYVVLALSLAAPLAIVARRTFELVPDQLVERDGTVDVDMLKSPDRAEESGHGNSP